MLEPYYDSYIAMIQMAGGVRRPVTLRAPDFRLDVDELRAAVTPRTRFVLLNSPHNPTGTVLTRAELQAVADLAIEHDLVVITDEVYEHLIYDDHEHVPLATLPGMFERTLTLSSAGQVLLLHRLEGRLGDRTGRAGRRRAGREAVADLHVRLTAAAGGRLRARRGARLPGEARRGAAGAARPALRGTGRRRARRTRPGGHLLRDHRHQRRSAGPTGSPSAWRCPSAPASSPSRPRASTTRDAGRQLVRWAFCKEPERDRGGAAPARGCRPVGVVTDVVVAELPSGPPQRP